MSASSVNLAGQRAIKAATPADTNVATLFTAGKEFPVVVEIWITNLTSSAANATVKWGNGTTDYSLIDTKSIAARDYLQVSCIVPLREGYTIKIQSGTNSALTYSITIVSTGSQLPANG